MKSEIKKTLRWEDALSANIIRCSQIIRTRVSEIPKVAIILGSGFGGFAETVEPVVEIPYSRLPGFPNPAVPGHSGKLIAGKVDQQSVLILSGRSHFYEGHLMTAITFPVRVLAELGIEILILTNAAGGMNRKFRAGDFMLIKDHINLMGENPLRGPVVQGRQRFIDMTEAYDGALRKLAVNAAGKHGIPLRKGVYLALSGPSYETPAEIKAFAGLGADAVGMSTVPETLVARQCGMRVLGLSCITNAAAGTSKKAVSHDEVLETGKLAGHRAAKLIRAILEAIDKETRP